MTRTYDEIVKAAYELRAKLIAEGKDPLAGLFFVTQMEKLSVLDHPPFMVPELSAVRDRICGLQIRVIGDGPP